MPDRFKEQSQDNGTYVEATKYGLVYLLNPRDG
jgi:hypothetical protein